MKQVLFTLSILCTGISVFAGPVDKTTAQLAAKNFLAQKGGRVYNKKSQNLTLEYSVPVTASSQAAYYVFNSASGFIIVSGDDAANPILAYSDEGSFNAKNISPSVAYMLSG